MKSKFKLASTANPDDARKKKMIQAVQAARRGHGLDDVTYRAMLAAHANGKTSSKDCTVAELSRVLDHLNGGAGVSRSGTADSPVAKKARALWLSLYHLGLVSDPAERALNGWVKRQYGVDDLRFLKGAKSFSVIEGLKQWATRAGVDWSHHAEVRRCVLSAQWAMLVRAHAAPAPDLAAFAAPITGAQTVAQATGSGLDRVIQALGQLVRGLK